MKAEKLLFETIKTILILLLLIPFILWLFFQGRYKIIRSTFFCVLITVLLVSLLLLRIYEKHAKNLHCSAIWILLGLSVTYIQGKTGASLTCFNCILLAVLTFLESASNQSKWKGFAEKSISIAGVFLMLSVTFVVWSVPDEKSVTLESLSGKYKAEVICGDNDGWRTDTQIRFYHHDQAKKFLVFGTIDPIPFQEEHTWWIDIDAANMRWDGDDCFCIDDLRFIIDQ